MDSVNISQTTTKRRQLIHYQKMYFYTCSKLWLVEFVVSYQVVQTCTCLKLPIYICMAHYNLFILYNRHMNQTNLLNHRKQYINVFDWSILDIIRKSPYKSLIDLILFISVTSETVHTFFRCTVFDSSVILNTMMIYSGKQTLSFELVKITRFCALVFYPSPWWIL